MEISLHIKYSAENVAYIETMSSNLGMTKKDFINAILDAHRRANADEYQQAQKRQAGAADIINNLGGESL